ncbi:hypothetical protein ACWDR0_22295 [Streptomyces sp. NPDC003691]
MNDVMPGRPGPEAAPGHAADSEGGADLVDGTSATGATGEPAGPDGAAPPTAYEPAAPAPLGVVRNPTGDAAVDAVLDRLADADHLTADGHLDVYEDVHEGLRTVLSALDAPGPAAQHPPHPVPHDHRS